MADNYPNLATPYDAGQGQVVPREDPNMGNFQNQMPDQNQQAVNPPPNTQQSQYPSSQPLQVGNQSVPTSPQTAQPAQGYEQNVPVAAMDEMYPAYPGDPAPMTPAQGGMAGPSVVGAPRRSSPFCWCCCFIVLLLIVAVFGIGIYAYYSDEDIPIFTDIVKKIEEMIGVSNQSGTEDTTGGEEEIQSPFDTSKKYTMEEFGLSVNLPDSWAFKKVNVGKVKASLLKSWLKDVDEYEPDDLVEPTKYQLTSPNEVILIGVIYEREEVCELATSQSDKYECYEEEYAFKMNNDYASCTASLTLKKGEGYVTSDSYELFSCELDPAKEAIWKKVAITSATLSGSDLESGEIKSIFESISEK